LKTKTVFRSVDVWLILAVFALSALSLFVLEEVTRTAVPGQPLYFVKHQVEALGIGFVIMIVVMNIPIEKWRHWRRPLYALAIVSLLVVLVHGRSALGAQRWIEIAGFQFQPSEFAKIALIIVLADLLERQKGNLLRARDMFRAILITGVPVLLVIAQPDLGTAIVMVGLLAILLFEAGAPGLKIIGIFGGTLAGVVLLVVLHQAFGLPLPLHQYQVTRLLVFLNPTKDPGGAGYNIIQSEIALGTGGLRGLPATALQPILSFLPANYTDFVFASLALETGLAGTTLAIGLYAFVVGRGIQTAYINRDPYASLVTIGATSLLAIHVLMNVGMAMGVMPVVGVPLPFLTYGGSSVITDFAAVGLILSARLHHVRLSFRR